MIGKDIKEGGKVTEMRTIQVTGKGKISIKPDQMRLQISLEGVFKEYGETLRHSSEDTGKLQDLISEFGFEKEELKTTTFHVDTEYESYEEEGVYKQRLTGYRYRHVMKLEFDLDNDRLGKILFALGQSDLKPELRISYTVKDPEAVKNSLLGEAVKDAKEKAAALTQAAGVSLKEIRNINYSWGELDLEVRPMNAMLSHSMARGSAKMTGSYDMNIQPEDIEVEDTVTVVWEIS